MKVPTLRNVDKRPSAGFVKAYGHNGYFKSLEEVVRFYASRGMMGGMGVEDGWEWVVWVAAWVAEVCVEA